MKPKLSVIIVASEGQASVAKLLQHLASQSMAPLTEVIVAAQDAYVDDLKNIKGQQFSGYHVVAADFSTSARARVAAINYATSPIIVFAEDHCFPVGDHWAETIIDAHTGPYAAVGPTMQNANPGTLTSWANLFVEYGPWMDETSTGEKDYLPGHNSSYKRDLLLSYGDRLSDILEAEWVLQADLRASGHRFLLAPDLKARHLNFSRISTSIKLQFFGGWMFAASRSADWNWPKRLFFALAWPAIVMLRAVRTWPHIRQSDLSGWRQIGCFSITVFLFLASGFGEAIGYAFGACGQRNVYARLEYRRWTNLIDSEKAMFQST